MKHPCLLSSQNEIGSVVILDGPSGTQRSHLLSRKRSNVWKIIKGWPKAIAQKNNDFVSWGFAEIANTEDRRRPTSRGEITSGSRFNENVSPQFLSALFSAIPEESNSETGDYKSKKCNKRVGNLQTLPENHISLGRFFSALGGIIAAFVVWPMGRFGWLLSIFLLFESTIGLLLGFDLANLLMNI